MTLTLPLATDRQVAFIKSLEDERNWIGAFDGEAYETVMNVLSGKQISKREASVAISALLAAPRKPRPGAGVDLTDLPLSKYALEGENGWLVFVEIVERRGGRRYMNRLIGAPGDWNRGRLPLSVIKGYAATIAEDPAQAALRFAEEFTCCAVCLAPLSDEESRRLGLGPICRRRF